ncbi:MAG TPA: hypothetical protein VGF86_05150 [Candidatus Tumulicola sp.]|jgi:hypothetical protein
MNAEVGILLVTGILTLAGGIGALAPRRSAALLFGIDAPDAATTLVVRHWSLLIALVGVLLIWAAYDPAIRVPVMVVAAIEKFAIAAFVFLTPLRQRKQTVAVVAADTVMAIMYVLLLARGAT